MNWGGPSVALPSLPPVGFLGEGDAVTKAIQDARQLLHGHSAALESSPSTPFRKVRAPTACTWEQGTEWPGGGGDTV